MRLESRAPRAPHTYTRVLVLKVHNRMPKEMSVTGATAKTVTKHTRTQTQDILGKIRQSSPLDHKRCIV